MHNIRIKKIVAKPSKVKPTRIKQLNFFDLIETYADTPIVKNVLSESEAEYSISFDCSKNVLICNVKPDNVKRYLDQSAKIYYTGKRFPATVALNKLYYFMPYIKRKGIRDLYLIKIARVGTRKEGQPDNDPNDFRLVFEIEFVKKLYSDYIPIHLDILRTYTDTTLGKLLKLNEDKEN